MVRVRALKRFHAGRQLLAPGMVLMMRPERARLLQHEGVVEIITETTMMEPTEVKSFIQKVREL